MLRAFILALHHDFGRVVHLIRQTNGRIRHIHMLAASTARTIGVDAQACRIDVYFDGLIHFWRDQHRGERRMPSSCRIKRGNTHQAMHAVLRFEIAESITPCDLEGRTFDTHFFAWLEVEDVVRIPVRL